MDNVVKERLINEDIVINTSSSNRVSTFWRCFIIFLTIINVTACMTACVCAAYCYKSSLIKDNFDETSTFKPDIGPTASAQAHPNYKEYVEVYQSSDLDYIDSYSEFSDYYDDIYDEDDDSDEYEYDDDDDDDDDDDENNNDDDDDNKTYNDEDDVEDSDNDDDGEGSGSEEDINDMELDIELKSIDKDIGTEPTDRKRRSANTDCNTSCKDKRNFANCFKRCERRKNRLNSKKEPKSIELPAAHFEASFTDNEVQRKVGDEFNSHRPTGLVPLRVFRKSSWFDDSKSPVTFSNSVMTAKSAGIYLVYAQAYIGGKEPSKSIAIVQRRGSAEVNKLRCDNGVNSGTDRMPQLQTCSVTGLMKLETGDTVEIQASKPTDQIMLQSDMTYFGLVKLGGVDVQTKNKSRKKNNA